MRIGCVFSSISTKPPSLASGLFSFGSICVREVTKLANHGTVSPIPRTFREYAPDARRVLKAGGTPGTNMTFTSRAPFDCSDVPASPFHLSNSRNQISIRSVNEDAHYYTTGRSPRETSPPSRTGHVRSRRLRHGRMGLVLGATSLNLAFRGATLC
jgi:hypothetical protein